MNDSNRSRINLGPLYRKTIVIIAIWTLLISASLGWNIIHEQRQTRQLAKNTARANFYNDMAFHEWAALHGGVYVPIDDRTLPIPYLSHVPERDITTPSGKPLTLVNPTHMLDKILSEYADLNQIEGRITGLNPLNPLNIPDAWERKTLLAFEREDEEIFEFIDIERKLNLRLMRSFVAREACLKCHGLQGYKLGEIMGGVGISVPMEPYLTLAREVIQRMVLTHFLLWVLGITAIGFTVKRYKKRMIALKTAEEALQNAHDELENRVKKRTAELAKTNEKLQAEVTDRKQKEAALRKKEEQYRLLFNSSNDAIFVSDLESGNFIEVNEIACQRLGYSKEELLKLSPLDISETEASVDAPLFNPHKMENSLEEKRAIFEVIHITKDGRRIPEEINSHLFELEGRKVVLAVARDITERKQAEEKIRRQKEFLEITIESLTHPFYVIDTADYKIEMANSVARQGRDLGRITCYALTHKKDSPCQDNKFPCPLLEVKKNGKPVTVEHTHYDKNNETRYVEVHAYPIFNDNGDVTQMIEYTLDITERRRAEEALKESERNLRQANAAKDKFFAVIAHDLKSPLVSIKLGSEALADSSARFDREEIAYFAKGMNDSVDHLNRLIENLLEWARSQTGRIKYKPQDINFNLITTDSIYIIEKNAAAKNIKLQIEIEGNLFVYADPNTLTFIIRNLVSNAVKFTEPGGMVKFSAQNRGDCIEASITDNGLGISQENIEKLFKIDDHHTTLGTANEKGTGLGLILCREFIEKNGGRIWIESEKGKGSVFRFTLPAAANSYQNISF